MILPRCMVENSEGVNGACIFCEDALRAQVRLRLAALWCEERRQAWERVREVCLRDVSVELPGGLPEDLKAVAAEECRRAIAFNDSYGEADFDLSETGYGLRFCPGSLMVYGNHLWREPAGFDGAFRETLERLRAEFPGLGYAAHVSYVRTTEQGSEWVAYELASDGDGAGPAEQCYDFVGEAMRGLRTNGLLPALWWDGPEYRDSPLLAMLRAELDAVWQCLLAYRAYAPADALERVLVLAARWQRLDVLTCAAAYITAENIDSLLVAAREGDAAACVAWLLDCKERRNGQSGGVAGEPLLDGQEN